MDKKTKIGILGAGVEGVAAAEYFAGKGFVDVKIFDQKKKVEHVIPDFVEPELGEDSFKKIFDREVLFRSPGIHTSKLDKARKKNIKVTSTVQYFMENCPCKIIGVTGTKGKGTTATLIYEILKKHGLDVHLGGNIGESPLSFLDELGEGSYAVLELSSFQLQDMTLSPQIAVVLMTTSEHLDYHADIAEYREAKKPILEYQKEDDICVLNLDYEYAAEFKELGNGKKFFVSRMMPGVNAEKIGDGGYVSKGRIYSVLVGKEKEVGEADKVGLLGAHNLENILAAVVVAVNLGVPVPTIRKALYEFKGLEHRLEFVREVNGIRFYNDSFSTTPETSIAAAYAFDGPVMLIAGGSEKGSDFSEWAMALQKNKNVKTVFLIGLMADRMEECLRNAAKILEEEKKKGGLSDEVVDKGVAEFPLKIFRCETLKGAVELANGIGVPGDNLVMSPAAASFDMFKNYKERGAAFKKIVNNL